MDCHSVRVGRWLRHEGKLEIGYREKFNRMIEGFKKKEAVEHRASGVDVE